LRLRVGKKHDRDIAKEVALAFDEIDGPGL